MCSVSRYCILHNLLMVGLSSINVAVSTSACLLVISFAWVWYRPVIGAFLIIGAAVPFLCSAIRLYWGDCQENHYRRLWFLSSLWKSSVFFQIEMWRTSILEEWWKCSKIFHNRIGLTVLGSLKVGKKPKETGNLHVNEDWTVC